MKNITVLLCTGFFLVAFTCCSLHAMVSGQLPLHKYHRWRHVNNPPNNIVM